MLDEKQVLDEKKICFILCTDDQGFAEESARYIHRLTVPEGYAVELLVGRAAGSVAAAYNDVMEKTDAKYKVYLRPGVFLIYTSFLERMINIFTRHKKVGMLGLVGNRSLAEDGCPFSDGVWRRAGGYYAEEADGRKRRFFSGVADRYEKMTVLDGLVLMTQYDLPWREDLFLGQDFYDCAQSLEFQKVGFEVGLPRMEEPWCLYDGETPESVEYERWRSVFEEEYGALYRQGKNGRRAVYQTFTGKESHLTVPYPPLVTEEGTDYIAFTTQKGVTSSFWDVLYRREWTAEGIHEKLGSYDCCTELDENEIITGKLFDAGDEGNESAELYPSRTRIPSFREIPDVKFDETKIIPTKKGGAYAYEHNPVLRGGPYEGRPLLLSIGMPVSNQIATIDRCLSHVRPLLDELDAELVIVDTGSTDGTVEVCRDYGARIVEFPWCDNMSAARNRAVYHSRGLWYMSIDDDEWFEDVEDILKFFRTGAYRDFDAATYIQRNYFYESGEGYQDNHTTRMAKWTPYLHFEGRIHDVLMGMPKTGKTAQLLSYVHHYGFVHDDAQKVREKYARNISILLQDVYEYPENLRFQYQMANELANAGHYEMAAPFFIRGLSMQRESSGTEFWGRLQAVDLVNAAHFINMKSVLPTVTLVKDRYDYTEAEQAYLAYSSMEAALELERYEEIPAYYREYREALVAYEKSPTRSNSETLTRLYVCNNDSYKMDAEVMVFSAYVALHRQEEALAVAAAIKPETVYAKKRSLVRYLFAAEQAVFEKLCGKLPEEWYRDYSQVMMRGCRAYLRGKTDHTASKQEEAVARLNYLLGRLGVPFLRLNLFEKGTEMSEELPDYLLAYLLDVEAETLGTREACFYAELLRDRITERAEDLPIFFSYVQMEGVFVDRYYANPRPGEEHAREGDHIQREAAAAYELYLGLQSAGNVQELTRHVETALKVYPGFAVQVNHLLKWIFEQRMV